MSMNPEESLLSYPMTIIERGRHGENRKLDFVSVYSPEESVRRIRMAKRYEELTIADDFIFGKVMEDKALCREGGVHERVIA